MKKIVILLCLFMTAGACAQRPGPVLPSLMDDATQAAIDRGLAYLAQKQKQDGSWLNSGGYGSYPQVMTSLAALAMMANGSTPEGGRYSRNVRRAMLYTLRVGEAANDGLIAGGGQEYQSMFGHGFSMLFLAQCYGVETNAEYEKRLRTVLNAGIKLIAKSQSNIGEQYRRAGGWIYTPNGNSDEGSVTITQLQALRACRNVGLIVPEETIKRSTLYLQYCQNPDGGISYSFSSRGSSRPAISAAGIACFYSAGKYDQGDGEEAKMVARLVDYCRKNIRIDTNDGHYFYMHFYLSQAYYMRSSLSADAKKDWETYYKQISQWLIRNQAPDGSWSGDGVGTTYGTALACMILQLPYGYLPIVQK